MINALPNTEMVFVYIFTFPGLLPLFRILLEEMCKLSFLWVDPLLEEPLPLSVGRREDTRGCSLNPLPGPKSVGVDVDLKLLAIRTNEKSVFSSQDLSLIPSCWEEDEDPQDEGGKAPHPLLPPLHT